MSPKNRKTGGRKLPASGLAEEILRDLAEEARTTGGREAIYRFADGLPQPEVPVEKETRLETWVSFRLARETYALPVAHVREIVRVESITRVPGGPREIRGVTNVRGRVIPVVDLRARLGLPAAGRAPRHDLLVAEAKGRPIGLLVDGVRTVERIDLLAVEPPPKEVKTQRSEFVQGVLRRDAGLTLLLDVDRVLLLDGEAPAEARPARRSRRDPASGDEA